MEPNLENKGKIKENIEISKGIYLLTLQVPPAFPLPIPGQFIHVKVGEPPQFLLRRPFSIFDYSSEKGELRIIYEVVGKGTLALSKKKEGEELDFLGPLGNGFRFGDEKVVILVGGGMGIAPLHLAGKVAHEKGKIVVSVLGFRSKERSIMVEKFRSFSRNLIVYTEDGSIGERGIATDFFQEKRKVEELVGEILGVNSRKRLIEEGCLGFITVFSCGPRKMLESITRICEKWNLPCQISLEQFMGCGVGLCMGCVVRTKGGYKRVCTEGPVFEGGFIEW